MAVIAVLFIVSLFAGSLPISIGSEGRPDATGERLSDLGTSHVQPGQTHRTYNSVPATSGPHYGQPLAPARWGVHNQALADEVLVHNLEHGGVGVHYNCPEGCDELVGQLASIVRLADEVILSPYPEMDTTIALTAWTVIDKFEEFDKERVENFIRAYVNSSFAPEASAR